MSAELDYVAGNSAKPTTPANKRPPHSTIDGVRSRPGLLEATDLLDGDQFDNAAQLILLDGNNVSSRSSEMPWNMFPIGILSIS